MKKAKKALIIAAAAVAAVGISAVSFAKWTGDTSKNVEVSGQTGSINTVGSVTVKADEASGTYDNSSGTAQGTMKALYPVDQDTGVGDGVKYWQFTVTVTGDGAQTVQISGTLSGGTANTGTPALMFKEGAAPTGKDDGAGKNISSAQTITTITGSTKTATIYVYLVADNTDSMGATVALTFTATATNA
ncbi:MAG: hypothetical protein J1G38_07350 [Clostridiales bacterium]|nr:hypothetical protein [Clostridiales bacterium]